MFVSCSVVSDSVTPTDCSPPWGFFVHGIFQARILEWLSIRLSRGSNPGLLACRQIIYQPEPPEKPSRNAENRFSEFQNSGHLSIWNFQHKKAGGFCYNIAEWQHFILLLSADSLDLWRGIEGSSKNYSTPRKKFEFQFGYLESECL